MYQVTKPAIVRQRSTAERERCKVVIVEGLISLDAWHSTMKHCGFELDSIDCSEHTLRDKNTEIDMTSTNQRKATSSLFITQRKISGTLQHIYHF